MKINFKVFVLVLIMAILLVFPAYADNSDNTDTNPVNINPIAVVGTDKIAVYNWALIQDRLRTTLVVEFTNVSNEIIPDLEAQIVFYDKEDNILEMVKDGHDVILPGTTVVSVCSFNNDRIFDYETVEVLIDTEKYTNHYVNHVENLEFKGNVSGNKIFLSVTNNDTVEIEEIEIVVVFYDKDNNIIGASEEEVHDLSTGAKTIMEFNDYNEADTILCMYYVNQAHTFDTSNVGMADTSKDIYTNSGVIADSRQREVDSNETTASSTETLESNEVVDAVSGFENIYNEYVSKIIDTTPILISEYEMEAAENSEGLFGLAEICYAKIEQLAEITYEGVEKMAEYMMSEGSGKYSEYSEWSEKLVEVYMEESQKITDAYMSSTMGSYDF